MKTLPTLSDKFTKFVNLVYCRRDRNQHDARLLWNDIKHVISDSDVSIFETEWTHYLRGEFPPSQLGMDINELKKYFTNEH